MNGFLSLFGRPDVIAKRNCIDDKREYKYESGSGASVCVTPARGETSHIARDKSGKIVCAFSGVIYKYGDSALKGESDGDYVIAAYLKYGESMCKYFEGKFVFALYDLNKSIAYLARDHFGGAPLYFISGDRFAAVSTSLSPLANCGLIEKEIDIAGLSDYFTLGYIPAPNTIFKDISSLRPGHMLRVDMSESRTRIDDITYWDVDCAREMIRDYEKCKQLLRQSLIESVDMCCTNESNGVYLSGGIDSTVVTGIASTVLGKRIDTFTMGFKETAYDESPRAKIAADAHRTIHHLYYLDYDEALPELHRVISGFDQPLADTSAIPTWIINKYAAGEGIRNVLTGDGSDQIFAGSNKYAIRYYVDKYMSLPGFVRKCMEKAIYAMPDKSAMTRKARKVTSCAAMNDYEMRRRMMQLCLSDQDLPQLLKVQPADPALDTVAQYFRLNASRTDELTNTLYVDLKVVADGGMMTKMGSMSRLAGVMTHMPIMSRSVLDAAFMIPPEYKLNKTNGKRILKDAFADIIPPELLNASKKGFAPPVAAWFRGPLADSLNKALDRDAIRAQGLLNEDYVSRLMSEHRDMTHDRSTVLWAIYVFMKWYESEF